MRSRVVVVVMVVARVVLLVTLVLRVLAVVVLDLVLLVRNVRVGGGAVVEGHVGHLGRGVRGAARCCRVVSGHHQLRPVHHGHVLG